jgi:hypothetical protein
VGTVTDLGHHRLMLRCATLSVGKVHGRPPRDRFRTPPGINSRVTRPRLSFSQISNVS